MVSSFRRICATRTTDPERMPSWARREGPSIDHPARQRSLLGFRKGPSLRNGPGTCLYTFQNRKPTPTTSGLPACFWRIELLVYPAFASHNVRSLAHAAAYARKLGLHPGDFEFQMLLWNGEADQTRSCPTRVSGPRVLPESGELVPGMAYLVRRLLENTSNEGFLRARFRGEQVHQRVVERPRFAG